MKRRAAWSLVLLALASCTDDAAIDPAAAPTARAVAALRTGVVYSFVRADSGKCLDVAGAGWGDGTSVLQWQCHGGANQQLRVDDLGGGSVRLVDQSSGKCIDVNHNGSSDGTAVQLWGCNGSAAQAFALDDVAPGYLRIRHVSSGKCVDVNRSSFDDGAKVQLWGCNGSSAQSFHPHTPASDAGDPGAPLALAQNGSILTMSTGNVRVDYDLARGTADFSYDGVRKIHDFYAGVQLDRYVTSRDYASRSFASTANQVVVTSTGNGLPTMQQVFNLSGGHRFLTRVVMIGSQLSSSWMAPVVMSTRGGVDIGSKNDARVLWVPFDNDAFVAYNAGSLGSNSGVSFEAAAFYDNLTRSGLVVGSVLHDTWKTGIYYVASNNRLDALNVFGGATDASWTHDKVPHAPVTGDTIYSPMMFVGFGPDWRDLLEEFADVNAFYVGKLAWSGGVPFGWNSWAKLMNHVSYDKAVAASDFIHANLQPNDFGGAGGVVYVNLDSYWDNLSDAQLRQFVEHCRANGQKAGIYWTPWVDWGKWDRPIEGSSQYWYSQIWLRDQNGNPIEYDGAYAVDPTHPGTKQRVDYYVQRFKDLGFEFVKLDFLSHGAFESTVRYDANARTGIAAYNQGMAYLRDRIAGSMFISESIAPIFPYQYAHARRISCDTFGGATGGASSQYELNSASYGWWLNGRLYQFNDPDANVFEGYSANENMTRLLSTVVSGTLFLNGDDLSGATGQSLARTYLTNARVNRVARLGKAFRPVEGNTGTGPSDVMVLRDGATTYLAFFNFGGATSRVINLQRVGLDPNRSYRVTDLWSGDWWNATGSVGVQLGDSYARLLQLE